MARVQFLGTGNAFCPPGRMHALALIDGSILVDAPPTLLPQLHRAEISSAEIEHLLFTHWHGDHMFGLPFFLLDRRYITDREGEENLTIHLQPGGREILTQVCRLAFIDSLDETLDERIEWNERNNSEIKGTKWSFERFPVSHSPETDPHGYLLTHESGFTLLHCGDSGPCEGIESRAANADVILVEMGVPDIVDTPHHHSPSDVKSLSERFPKATILVTHNFASGEGEESGFAIPELPDTICQLEDGDSLIISDDGGFLLKKID